MVTRNIKSVITIGGSIAASLPSSTKRAVAELDRLKTVQQADVAEANRLKTAIRGLARGSDEYKARVQQLKDVQERINYRTDEIGRVGAAARESGSGVHRLTQRFSALRAGLGPVGLAIGAITGLTLAMGAAFSRAGTEANSILITSARFGVSTEAFQRGAAYMREFTQDAGAARQRFESLLGVAQDFERVRFGEQLDPRRFLAAARLGINVNDLIQGRLEPTELFEQVAAGFQDLAPEEARLRAEVLLGPELAELAAGVAEGNLSVEEANRRAERARILSDEQLRANQAAGQNIDEIKQILTELLNQVTSHLIPPILAVARHLTGFETQDEQLADLARRAEESGLRGLTGDLQTLGQENVQATRVDVPFGPDVERIGGERTPTEDILARVRAAAELPLAIAGIPGVGRGQSPGELVREIIPELPESFPLAGGFIPELPSLPFDLPIADSFIPELPSGFSEQGSRVLDNLRGFGEDTLSVLRAGAGSLGGLIGRQTGGITRPGETTLVGEAGPEIARFPAGTEIIPNRELGGVGSSGPMTVTQTFYVTINNPSSDLDIERSLAEAAGRVGAGVAGA